MGKFEKEGNRRQGKAIIIQGGKSFGEKVPGGTRHRLRRRQNTPSKVNPLQRGHKKNAVKQKTIEQRRILRARKRDTSPARAGPTTNERTAR